MLPDNYLGVIYVSACYSAPVYVNNLLAALGTGYRNRIFGMYGNIDYMIAAPNDGAWVAAK